MSNSSESPAPSAVLDPVCGMTITPEEAVGKVEHKGETYYFCSETCLEQFRASPEQFLSGTRPAATPAPPGTTYVCPMDPEVRQSQPGACPKCGMALEPDLSRQNLFLAFVYNALGVPVAAGVLYPFLECSSVRYGRAPQ